MLEPTEYLAEIEYALAGRQWVEVADRPPEEWLPGALASLAEFGVLPGDPSSRAAAGTRRPESVDPSPARAAESPAGATEPASGSIGRLLDRAPLVGRRNELALLLDRYLGAGPALSST